MREIVYLCLGGPEESMKLRVEALKKQRKEDDGNGTFILDGFSSEISFMKQFFPGEFPSYAYAYDTLSNIQRCSSNLRDADVVYVSTSSLHWERIKIIISRKFPELLGKFIFIPSGEVEVKYAKFSLWMYKTFGPTSLQWAAKITRWKKYRREYIAPLRERALCALLGVYY